MQPQFRVREDDRSSSSYKKSNKPSSDVSTPTKKGKRQRMTLLFIAIICMLYWASSVWAEQQKVIALKQEELQKLQKKLNEANEQQVDLTYQIKRLEDRDYIAEVARRDYFLSYPGEVLFQVPKK